MSFIKITGNAIDFNVLLSCIGSSPGSRGQNRLKENVSDRILKAWPELDPERDDVGRIDDKSPEAKKTREVEIDTEEQGALAETFLAAIKPDTTPTSRFGLFKRSAKLIQVSKWWDKQTSEKLAPFAGEQDFPEPVGDAPKTP